MKNIRLLLSSVVLSAASASAFASVSVSSDGTGTIGILTDLGSFAAGTYTITASGQIDLADNTGRLTVKADGTPFSKVTFLGYEYFNYLGSDHADGKYGAAGTGVNLGALIGSYSSNPAAPADWFLIGTSKTVTLDAQKNIYVSVKDTDHHNNVGTFEVTVTAVPEPESYAMLLSGLGLMGFVARRRKDKSV